MRGRWLIMVLLAAVLLMALGSTLAQTDLIPDMQTVEAAVQARFTATAAAQVYSTLALTVDAIFAQALTATAQSEIVTPSPSATVTNFPLTLTAQLMLIAQQSATPQQMEIEGAELSAIPGGTFEMGTTPQEVAAAVRLCVADQGGSCLLEYGEDSVPEHTVSLSPYYMEIPEVTVDEYVRFLNWLGPNGHRAGCDGLPCAMTQAEDETSNIRFDGRTYSAQPLVSNYPVTNVTWYGADAYCKAIGRRLPTEAEWEFGARGNTGYIYPWGNTWDPAYAKTSIPETGEVGPVPVMSYRAGASPFYLADMAGNAAEWVNDWYDPTYYQKPEASGLNPTGPIAGDEKVIRGGSWDAKPFFARSVHRQSRQPTFSGPWLGFRCAADSGAAGSVLPSPTFEASFVPGEVSATPTDIVPSPQPTKRAIQATPTMTPTRPSPTPSPRAIEATPTFTPSR